MRRRILLVKKSAPVENYLRIQPIAPQWITVGELVVYDIESNVDWIIV